MKTNIETEQYEKIYRRYVNDVYRICFYYLNDEAKSKSIVEEAFTNLYKHINEVEKDCVFGYLVHEVKGLIQSNQKENLIGEEVRE